MNGYLVKRVIEIAEYIVENNCTVREAAKAYGVSKSTVHKDCSERVYELDRELYKKVSKVLARNLAERHLRGGLATKQRFERKRGRVARPGETAVAAELLAAQYTDTAETYRF